MVIMNAVLYVTEQVARQRFNAVLLGAAQKRADAQAPKIALAAGKYGAFPTAPDVAAFTAEPYGAWLVLALAAGAVSAYGIVTHAANIPAGGDVLCDFFCCLTKEKCFFRICHMRSPIKHIRTFVLSIVGISFLVKPGYKKTAREGG